MKQKYAYVWALLCAILGLVLLVVGCKSTLDNKTTNDAYVINKSDFSIYFSGPIADWALDADVMAGKLSNVGMAISDSVINGEEFSCNIEILLESGSINLPICGTLKSGFRSQTGMNSIIVEVDDEVNDYEVRLFEIVNDRQEDTYLLYPCIDQSKSVSGSPHLRVYLEGPNGVLYLFESALPDALQNLRASDYKEADQYKDAIYWAIDLVSNND